MIHWFGVEWGTPLQLVTMLLTGGILGVFAKMQLGNREMSLDAEELIRKHFGQELTRLTDKSRESDERHDRCEREKRELRDELEKMHTEIRGLQDQLRMYSAGKLIELSSGCPSEAVLGAAYRIVEKTGSKKQ